MGDAVEDTYLVHLPQISMNLFDGYISSYWSIIAYPKHIYMINKEKNLTGVIGDIE